ncbi:MAG: UDP-N-acetylmuramate dehydrogenase [Dehalococcoidia bacterium]|nr:MAG: UDP-N-acetylmuramate dehydrogenase [Dehalococcoidia bacterium]
MNEAFLAELRALGPVLLDEPLSRHTTIGIGGPADVYFEARTEEELRAGLRAARQHGVPLFILGAGSNVLILDSGVRGLVMENATDQVDGPVPNGSGFRVRVASGVSLAALARRLAFAGYGGLEWACGIPGTLGGAAVYNAGAYGSSLLDNLKGIRIVDPNNGIVEMRPEDLALGYRTSAFTRGALKDHVVLSLDLTLQKGDPAALRARVRELDARRLAAQPRGRSAGSMFKNPAENPAWWLINQAGLRGHRIGNAQISDQHTNFFLNLGGARAADVLALMELPRSRVRERFGVELENEVALVGEP